MSQQPYYASNTGGQPVVVQGQPVASNYQPPPAGNVHGSYAGSSNIINTFPVQTHNHGSSAQNNSGNFESFNLSNHIPSTSGTWTKGEVQPKRCNDVFFAILFYAHLVAVGVCAAIYAPPFFQVMSEEAANAVNNAGGGRRKLRYEENEDEFPLLATWGKHLWQASSAMLSHVGVATYSNTSRYLQEDDGGQNNYNGENNQEFNTGDVTPSDFVFEIIIIGAVGFGLSGLALGFLMRYAATMIKIALVFNLISLGLITLATLLGGAIPMALLSGGMLVLMIFFTMSVWNRIPFAASNLTAAVTAVRANMGLSFFAYGSLVILLLWTVWWSIASTSTMYMLSGDAEECDGDNCEIEPNATPLIGVLFLLSFHWTYQVVKNVVHTTVAGTVGTWWFAPKEASSCCSQAVRDSYLRSITYSFGSICLGSLIVAIIQTLRDVLRSMREQDDGLLVCLADCLLSCIEQLAEYFNQWAFVYVGLYGYSFIDAGRNVMQLFYSKGWTAIITDYLVDRVLTMVSIGVGVLTGLLAMLIAAISSADWGDLVFVPFVLGFIVGAALCLTLTGVVGSAVNTVIVCFAEAPAEFQANHPELSNEMRASWQQAFPDQISF